MSSKIIHCLLLITRCKNGKPAYVTLVAVLVVGAVSLAVSTSLIMLGLGTSRTSLARAQSYQAKSITNACAEMALEGIRLDAGHLGTQNLTLGQGSCSYTVTTQGGESRIIEAIGTVGTVVRKMKISITAINPYITVSSWKEVSDF
ncbi:MAG: hypothetical protein OEL89_03870 [Candidatus Peregrinibacteria bacterium]|nr:hypothetical protein [Candidatus Peregrinibacteria bacterium]